MLELHTYTSTCKADNICNTTLPLELDKTCELATMNLIFLCFILFNVVTVYVTGENDVKRLLLNDPDVVQDRFNRMENMLAMLNSTVKQLSLSTLQQATTIQQQGTTIQQQQTEIRQLRSTQGKCETKKLTLIPYYY